MTLSIAFLLRYSLKTIQIVLDSSLMVFASPLSYMMQLLHSLVLTHHLLHPSLALLLCFRRLPSEPQGRAYNPELLQATVLPSHHGLARYGLSPALTTARICFTDRIFFSHSPPSGVWLVPPFWTMFLHCFLHHVMEGGDLPWQELLLDWSRLIHSTCFSSFAVTLLHRWLEKETSLHNCSVLTISSAWFRLRDHGCVCECIVIAFTSACLVIN